MYAGFYIVTLLPLIISLAEGHRSNLESAEIKKFSTAEKAKTNGTTSGNGQLFDRFVIIWLENTDVSTAASDPDLLWLAERGILLTNYWALTHPSEPNYIASVGGNTFGLSADSTVTLPKNVSSVVDLLDAENISWAEYEEGIPYSGFEGSTYSNKKEGEYARKHNPLISYDSVTENTTRLSNIKNFTEFDTDLKNRVLPQWMFITPNLINDGHNSNIKTSGRWCRSFLEPLLNNKYFVSNTLILITFDENESYGDQNRVWSLLLGGAIDELYHNTSDHTYYTHYSELSTAENNWGLYNLGRNDTNNNGNANVFQIVAKKTGYKNKDVNTSNQKFNSPIPGYFGGESALPDINCSAIGTSGKAVLDSIKKTWCSDLNSTNSSGSSTSSTNTSKAKSVSHIVYLFCFIVYMLS